MTNLIPPNYMSLPRRPLDNHITFCIRQSETPLSPVNKSSLIYQQMGQIWDPIHFRKPVLPEHIGTIQDRDTFTGKRNSHYMPYALHIPIKRARQSDFIVPKAFAQLQEPLQISLNHARSHYPLFDASYVYLSVSHGVVNKGQFHRIAPIVHADGVQRKNPNKRTAQDLFYIGWSDLGTIFYDQPFDLSAYIASQDSDTWVPQNYNLFKEFSKMVQPDTERQFPSFQVYAMNPYSVHRAQLATKPTERVWFRLRFSLSRPQTLKRQ